MIRRAIGLMITVILVAIVGALAIDYGFVTLTTFSMIFTAIVVCLIGETCFSPEKIL